MTASPWMASPERNLNPPDDAPAFTPEQLQAARDEIIETILLFGQWPQPRSRRTQPQVTKEFDLYDFLADRTWELITEEQRHALTRKGGMLELNDLLEFFILAMQDHGICGAFSDSRDRWEKKITLWLIAFFDDTERGRRMVEERAERNADDANE